MMARLCAAGAVALVALLASCRTGGAPGGFKPTSARFFLEAADARGLPVTLPQSDVRIVVNAQPVINDADIVNVELAQVELGKCLLFQLTPAAARDLYRLTASHQGRRLVLFIDGAPLGARPIDGPLENGTVMVFAEVADTALPQLVDNLKKSAAATQRELTRKG